MRLVFDIETNGLLPELHTIHCICIIDADTGQEWNFANRKYRVPMDGTIEDALQILTDADELIGHNIVGFDIPALLIVYGWTPSPTTTITDTYVKSMVAFPNLKDVDFRLNRYRVRTRQLPLTTGFMVGSHQLKGWGLRLGIHKGDYGDNRKDWSVFDTAMMRYCMQDVRVNLATANRLDQEDVRPSVLHTETRFAHIMGLQQRHGFDFDVEAAEALTATLQIEQAKLHAKLDNLFPPRIINYLTPKKKLPRTKEIVFNPGSRDQIAWNLTDKYGWEPTAFTKTGKPKIDDAILGELDYPEAQLLARSLMIGKRIGAVSDGKGAWLKKVGDDGAMHGRVINIGTPHGRCAHTNPNMAQVPSLKKEYGKECRSMFRAREGRVIVGCDASGIQLRALAHYLAPYDDKAYVGLILSGDPHSANQAAAGLATRDQAKTFIYAFLFGAGDKKIGSISGDGPDVGKATKASFLKKMPAVELLSEAIAHKIRMNDGNLRGIDGRVVPCPSIRHGLNYLLTSFEAAVMKLATVLLHDEIAPEAGLVHGTDYWNVAHVHDEYQFECVPEKAETLGQAARQAIITAGVRLGTLCPMDGEYKVGATWYDTH